jgi:hypothetical protein
LSTSKQHRARRKKSLYMYGEVCMCCGKTEEDGEVMQADHIFPKVLFPQYKDCFANYQILCKTCNSKKDAKFIKDYRYELKNMKRYSDETCVYLGSIKETIREWWRIHLAPPKVKKKKVKKQTCSSAGTIVKRRGQRTS